MRWHLAHDAIARNLALVVSDDETTIWHAADSAVEFHGLRQSGRAEYGGDRPDAVATLLDLST